MAQIWLLAVLFAVSSAQFDNYPNPMKSGSSKTCGMKSLSFVCDPDQVLPESDRYRLNNALLQITRRTGTGGGNKQCDVKGIDAYLAVGKTGDASYATKLNEKWNVDQQCRKAIVFYLAADARQLYYSGEENTRLSRSEFDTIVDSQRSLLSEGTYGIALDNIFKQIGVKDQASGSDAGGSSATPAPGGSSTSVVPFSLLILASALYCWIFH